MASGDDFVTGQHKVKGKVKMTGNIDVLKPGDPGHGAKASSELPLPKGLRVEVEKGFKLHDKDKATDMVRVIDVDPNNKYGEIVLFSGTQEQFAHLKKAVNK
jgi:hypothetical protein